MQSRLCTADEAVSRIASGGRIAIGGSILGDHPMGIIRAMVRAGLKDLTILTVLGGLDIDLLVSAGCVARVEAAYVGLGVYGLAKHYRSAAQRGDIEVVDFSEASMLARFRAVALGLPMMPVRSILGTHIMDQKDYVQEIRCPFTNVPLACVRAASTDFTILHVAECDEYGNVRRPKAQFNPNTDDWLAAAATQIIISTERVVDHAVVQQEPHETWIPAKRVCAVVHMPFGAHPGSCNGEYGVDTSHLDLYTRESDNPDGFSSYLSKYVFGPTRNTDYLEAVGIGADCTCRGGKGI